MKTDDGFKEFFRVMWSALKAFIEFMSFFH